MLNLHRLFPWLVVASFPGVVLSVWILLLVSSVLSSVVFVVSLYFVGVGLLVVCSADVLSDVLWAALLVVLLVVLLAVLLEALSAALWVALLAALWVVLWAALCVPWLVALVLRVVEGDLWAVVGVVRVDLFFDSLSEVVSI